MKIIATLFLAIALGLLVTSTQAGTPGALTVNVGQPGSKIGSLFYGLMTEEINHSYDGGLYAELIQNRIFQDGKSEALHWSVVETGNGSGKIAIDTVNPVNTVALTRSLRLDITKGDDRNRVGVANDGFWGIPVLPNSKYRASFYARVSQDFVGQLHVKIENHDGSATFASADVPSVGTEWKKYEVTLTTAQVPVSTANRFVITGGEKGSVWFSLVSLFPPTFNDRPDGNRIDLMQKMADLRPKFLRFPGGNYLEGNTIAERFNWKETIGPLEERPGHQCPWGYRSSDGLGLLEFLLWCEDLKVERILAVYAGYSLQGQHVDAGPELEPFVQEAMDEIEYCMGDASTTWGARMRDGHPEPFPIRFVEVGNEDMFDRSHSYDGRFAQFYDAIKAKYPSIQVISTMPVQSRKADLVDDHDYPGPGAMLRGVRRYQNRNADLPKVFFGEWATQDGQPTPTLRAALADVAWLTGLQQDADAVPMNCYAPLFVNVNPNAWQWRTNLIGYDAATSFGSPSYYAQAMYSRSIGDRNLPVVVTTTHENAKPPQGAIGIGTWNTQARYKEIKVTRGNETLFAPDLSKNLDAWTAKDGQWSVKDGDVEQALLQEDVRLTAGDVNWSDYTLNLKARKTGGSEGFLVLFHVKDSNNMLWFNVGGWGNSRTCIEQIVDGQKSEIGAASSFVVETDRWYDLRVELKGKDIKCYIDDKLVCQATNSSPRDEAIFAAASRIDATGEISLTVVNVLPASQDLKLTLDGITKISPNAEVEVLSGQPSDMNSLRAPLKVAPKPERISNAAPTFVHEFPASSVTVMRFKPE